MTNSVLITRPNHDLPTTYLLLWSQFVVDMSNKRRKTLDLIGKKANSKNFKSYIDKHKPGFIFINGHGNDKVLTGYDNEILVEIGKNEKLLSDSIVYARSCSAANILGLKVANDNNTTFIGYKKMYKLGRNPLKAAHPIRDEVARLFLEPSNLVAISVIKGNTAQTSMNRSQEAMKKNFFYMLSSKATSNQRDAAVYLWSNIKNQVLLGDPNKKLS